MRDTEHGCSPPGRQLRSILAATLALQLVGIVTIGRSGGFSRMRQVLFSGQAAAQPSRPANLRSWEQSLKRDPGRGTQIPQLMLTASDGARFSSCIRERPAGVLFISSCAMCVASNLADWDQLQRQYPRSDLYVVPAVVDSDAIEGFRSARGLSVRFVVAGAERLTAVCNPCFLPRAYLFDGARRLIYMQPPGEATASALAHVRDGLSSAERGNR